MTSDPQRWADAGSGAPDEIRALLDMARHEGPTIAQKATLAAKLGLPGSGIMAVLGAKGALVTATFAAGAIGVAVAQFQQADQTVANRVPPSPVPSYAPPEPEPVKLIATTPLVAETEVEDEDVAAAPPVSEVRPRVAVQSRGGVQQKSTAPVAAPDKPSEASLIRVARDQIASSPGSALAILKRHQVLYPSGILSQEREVLMIEALRGIGQKDAAHFRAREFKNAHPDSGHEIQE